MKNPHPQPQEILMSSLMVGLTTSRARRKTALAAFFEKTEKKCFSVFSKKVIDRLPTDYRPITDRLPTGYRPVADRCSFCALPMQFSCIGAASVPGPRP